MLALYTAALLVGSCLLFLVQPMFAKMVLPLLGGSPAIWITCMLFFQAALLAGYAYAHWSTRRLGARRQAALHAVLLFLPLLSLPIGVPEDWRSPGAPDPLPWLLALLAVSVGLPFFLVATTAPLLQRWFAGTGHPAGRDPYFLYRASNLGSMVGLLGYPAFIEPRLRLGDQGWLWAGGYGLLMALTLGCAVALWRSPRRATEGLLDEAPGAAATEPAPDDRVTARRRLRWVALAFVPSSFMLAVTTYVTTDIAAVPLLWVVPLAIYLLTFVLAFSRNSFALYGVMEQVQPFLLLELAVVALLGLTEPLLLLVALNLVTLFVSGLVCHVQLSRDRPPAARLTEFYLWIALGGALGGVFNAVVAPLLFDSVVEYPLVLVLACLLRPAPPPSPGGDQRRRGDLVVPFALGSGTVGLLAALRAADLSPTVARGSASVAGVLVCAAFFRRPLRLGLALAAVMMAVTLPPSPDTRALFANRTFFGVLRVEDDRRGRMHRLVHGNTNHGAQSLDPRRRREPLTYFHHTGPAGQLFAEVPSAATSSPVAVVGLGVGSLACYARPGQPWTFYEIDPEVERIARDPRLFTYLGDCAPQSEVVLGDGRLSLARAPGRHYGVIVLDAFNSDAIPVHLLTREALSLYVDKLADGGVLAAQVTNRYLDLRPVLGDLAGNAGLVARARTDLDVPPEQAAAGKLGSVWVVMARRPEDLGALAEDPHWEPLRARPGAAVWTDDFSNVLGAFKRG